MRCLNLGCGSRFHPEWTNVDIASRDPRVQAHDLRQGIPFPDQTFDVVYHSHLLEHLPQYQALDFLRECFRVLKSGGITRVAVPDLEQIALMYLQALDNASQGEDMWQHHYEWMMLELYDQAVRESSGGGMVEYLRQEPIPNERYVLMRIGDEARRIAETPKGGCTRKERGRPLYGLAREVRRLLRSVRARGIRMLLGEWNYKALQTGCFRLSGEVHLWMYDRYSLAQLLEQAGFHNPTRRTAFESAIEHWVEWDLDSAPDDTVRKPDSLYMEAVKPAL